MRRRSVVAALLAAGAGAHLLRRRRGGGAERVDVHYDDGSMVSLEQGPELERLLTVAREGLAAARG